MTIDELKRNIGILNEKIADLIAQVEQKDVTILILRGIIAKESAERIAAEMKLEEYTK